MKKVFIILLLFTVSSAFADNFSPSVLQLSAPDVIQYDFDGTSLTIPVTVSGTVAEVIFLVYTKDMASNISAVQNGHLGWHYVNKVDTCMYVSGVTQLDMGVNTLSWDGKNSDGDMVPAGEYTYYVWGFDSMSQRILACKFFGATSNQAGMFQQYDVNNNALDVPIYYPPAGTIPQVSGDDGGWGGSTAPGIKTRAKWVIGSDPEDSTLIETTTYMGWGDHGKIALMPGDHQYFIVQNYISKDDIPGGQQNIMKWKWTPNGLSEQETDFGEDGVLSVQNTSRGYAGPISDNVSSLWLVIGDNSYPDVSNPEVMLYVDPEAGTIEREYDFSWLWWDPVEAAKEWKYHGGPTIANFFNGRMYCAGLSFCTKHCIDPYQEDDDEVTIWINNNGDYVGDRFFQEDVAEGAAWLCSAWSGPPWTYDFFADMNGFSICSAYDLGALSFALFAPDGTGIDYFAFSGETASLKFGQPIVDNGSAYDGIYCGNTTDEELSRALWYVGNDSITGVITSSPVAVDEAAPSAFAVAQNTPNPFNPSTTISFTIPEAGTVSVDVFNIAGQKIATVADDFMSSGSHSVSWDATGFSGGVYFYTVKSGDFSKTMKMTLIK